jgi:uncharacterized protein (TIGR02757 family)
VKPSVESYDWSSAAVGLADKADAVRFRDLRTFLDKKVAEYNAPSFIANDPVSIPHEYTLKQDIEISAFFTAIFSWGNRTNIIRKTQELMQLMDRSPYQFILQHKEKDLKAFLGFKHRTFNATDLLYFISFFRHHYSDHPSLEDAFLLPWEGAGGREQAGTRLKSWRAESALSAFYHYFFSLDDAPPRTSSLQAPGKNSLRDEAANDWPMAYAVPPRTRKHIASPEKHSACKRINMFLRWMVRKDDHGVDFGIWRRIPMARLICPLDLHVARVAKRFGLLSRKSSDWLAATELTDHLLLLDPKDPTKYDFALFGLGVIEKY